MNVNSDWIKMSNTAITYRSGGDGFIKWMEDKVYFPITPFDSDIPVWTPVGNLPDEKHPETGRSYKDMWEMQKPIFREALRMENNRFIYRLIILCWQRGEGKSLILCCIFLWKFFEFARQKIVCSANSKDQVAFVHYDIMKDLILNSPELSAEIGAENVKEKSITFKNSKGVVQSSIQTISTFSGIVSNITGYTFSEMFEQKNPNFFVRIDGSIRNIPNAFGGIDSTVSDKQHQLHKLYQAWLTKADPTIFFSYRCSKEGDPADYMNPMMTKAQLDSYRAKFPFGDFERFFLNLWEIAGEKVFTKPMIESTNYLGIDKQINCHNTLMELIDEKNQLVQSHERLQDEGIVVSTRRVDEINSRFWNISDILPLKNEFSKPELPTLDSIEKLSDIFDTNWALTAGLDRSDPMAQRSLARTIVSFTLKGLIGSRKNPFTIIEGENPPYIYICIHLKYVEDASLEGIKRELQLIHDEMGGIDALGGESWGAWDLAPWCEDKNIQFETWTATYDRQKAMFTEFFNAIKFGRYKIPPLAVAGSKNDDIFKEEAEAFDHVPPESGKKTGWFGSPEKFEVRGIQDDAMFSLADCIYVGRKLSPLDFKERKGNIFFGSFFEPGKGLMGNYS